MAIAPLSMAKPIEEGVVGMFDRMRFIVRIYRSLSSAEERVPFEQQVQLQRLQIEAQRLDSVVGEILRWITQELLDDNRWRALADRPRHFRQEMDRRLKLFSVLLRARYGIESNRQPRNWSRDGQIMMLHDLSPKLDFQTIGKRFGITAKAAERAYERHSERVQRAFRYLRECLTYMCQLAESEYAFLLEPPRPPQH